MKKLSQRLEEIAFHLQSLGSSKFFPKIQKAIERKDKASLIIACKEARIPSVYLSTIVAVLLSASPMIKWPEIY
jgi:hypothetical protein